MKYAEWLKGSPILPPHDMDSYRIIYGRVYSDAREAEKAALSINDYAPSIKAGKGSYFVELGRYRTRPQADSAYAHYRGQGLRVFIQKLEER